LRTPKTFVQADETFKIETITTDIDGWHRRGVEGRNINRLACRRHRVADRQLVHSQLDVARSRERADRRRVGRIGRIETNRAAAIGAGKAANV
jgi:hypothetical protein